ncbi:VWA domain-containing protein [Wenxinia marina]|uniref:von Willebrand factor type A domain protein n=1 Tax=Wenxinia marina DSM 24838 TaxID=1123501 RepID=A0A0D0QCC6_9RHOB|nr:VWA domain-containing protein [Wenxinia marina]KIQ69977.1 von Willebrand factor type A domain protein [Wenxinia marina DSM 24838]GGL62638.1 hypothetical protein GCM10011392_16520 [Wenxinia marina]
MIRRFATFVVCLALAASAAVTATAQERPATILVLDGSGSMWGQIDGVNKIVIAREAVGEILQSFPADESLGLTVYGHRVEGDCTDIETVIEPAEGTADAILGVVNSINPRGKTPMIDSVVAAAEALRFTDAPATVILVSDGIETCNPDPCAAARVLEETGVNFTAHVIGFDVANEPEALAQMQCIADETGGLFLAADDADQLGEALTVVVAAATGPAPEPVTATFEARIGDEGGPLVEGLVRWTLSEGEVAAAVDVEQNPFVTEIEDGTWTATAYRVEAEDSAVATVEVTGEQDVRVVAVFPELLPSATVSGPATAVAGDTVDVSWTGPDEDGDYIAVGTAGESGSINYTYTRDGTPAALQMPPTEGTYELRYIRGEGSVPLATSSIVVEPVPASVTAPDPAPAGATVPVDWTGPDYDADYIAVATPGEDGAINYAYTRDGTPAMLQLPTEPGDYEIRYVMAQDTTVIATAAVTVTDVSITVSPPAEAVAGDTVPVAWDGPDYAGDYIAVGVPGEDRSINYTYTRDGTPADLQMPVEPGEYEVRYVLSQGGEIAATAPITVTALDVSVLPPDTATAGDTVHVAWDGPDYAGDYVAVAVPGEERSINYTYTRNGNPAGVVMPTEPGEYEVRYVLSQGNTVVATAPITVNDLAVSVVPPAEATAGDTVPVAWDGPDYANDYIAVAVPGEDRSINYTYTRNGSPAMVQMPTEPGEYEVRYVLSQGNAIAATAPITVSDLAVSVVPPAEATAGDTVPVAWDGPDYAGDYIAVAVPGEDRSINYTYTRNGTPAMVQMPTEPGDYEIRYVLSQGNEIAATAPITVSDLAVSVTAPAEAVAGATVMVEWDGPDYSNDYIAVAEPGEDRSVNYTYTRNGNPAGVVMPTEPGTYEIRYVLAQGNEVAARTTITVTDVKPTLEAPQTAIAGETVMVGWDGPDYPNDYIAVAVPGEDRSVNYTYTRNGNPAGVVMPTEPGTYELRYVLAQGNTVVASQTIEVSEVKATLSAPQSAPAGGTIPVGWEGPDYSNDYIAVATPGEDRSINYTYTRNGNPAEVTMPVEPGDYELRYVLAQGNTVIGRLPIAVTPLSVRLVAPPSGEAGGTVTVGWDGPDYPNDYVAIAVPGEDRSVDYAYTRNGNPLEVDLPEEPGTYELRYVLNQGNTVVATMPFTVE